MDSHDVRAGDVLVGRDGSRQRVQSVSQEFVEGFEVRNLTVQEHPSYAVGDCGLLAHNEGVCEKLRKSIEEITAKHGNLNCYECAAELKKLLDEKGVAAEIVEMKWPGNGPKGGVPIWSDYYKGHISENGVHRGVLVDGVVFDNVHKKGVAFDDWVKDKVTRWSFEKGVGPDISVIKQQGGSRGAVRLLGHDQRPPRDAVEQPLCVCPERFYIWVRSRKGGAKR